MHTIPPVPLFRLLLPPGRTAAAGNVSSDNRGLVLGENTCAQPCIRKEGQIERFCSM